jgi:hypothetical protein
MSSKLWLSASVIVLVCSVTRLAHSATYSFGQNLGQLNYQQDHRINQCTIQWTSSNQYPPPVTYTYYEDYFSSLVYVNSGVGINQVVSGTLHTISQSPGAGMGYTDNCPNNINSPIHYQGTGYTIGGSANGSTLYPVISVPGYLNPKYQIVGVIYAPPGSRSSVSYTNSDLVNSTVTTKNSYASGYRVGVTTNLSAQLAAWKFGSLDTSTQRSTTWSQATTTTDSSAVTVQKQTGYQNGPFPGPVCDYCGVDHDYDVILVWLNPVQLLTLTNGGVVQPNGYGFSSLDQPGMDIYQVYAGELNGDLPVRQSTTNAFARSWASTTNFNYNTGSTPGLTAQDKVNVLLTDPFWNCTYKSPTTDGINCAKPADANFTGTVNTSGTAVAWVTGSKFDQLMTQSMIVINGVSYTVASVNSATSITLTTSAGTQSGKAYSVPSRFTQSGSVNFSYTQPPPGGQPSTQAFMWTYTNTNTTGAGYNHENKVEYGLEKSFGGKIFDIGFKVTLSKVWTITHTYETSSQIITQNSSSATASITGPACNNVSGACNPVYPPVHALTRSRALQRLWLELLGRERLCICIKTTFLAHSCSSRSERVQKARCLAVAKTCPALRSGVLCDNSGPIGLTVAGV